jgi:hypothetical protein
MPFHQHPLPLWARVADVAVVALLALALFVAIDGGFVLWTAGVRISVRSEWRPFFWAAILAGVRHLFVPSQPLHERLIAGLTAVVRAQGPLPDDSPGGTATPADPHPGRRRRALTYTVQTAGVLFLYAALTALMTYPQVMRLSRAVAVNEGDALFSTWRLAWIAHQLPIDPLHLFDANIFHPERLTLAFSDSMIVPGLMAAPLLWLGVPQLFTYNLTFLSAFAFSGAGMFLLVRSLTRHTPAALLAGFIFAFLPFRFMHYAHLELQMAHWMPLCLWAVHLTIQHGRLRDGLLAGLFLALQCLSSWYYGIFLATFLAPVGAALLIGQSPARWRQSMRSLAAGGLLASVLVIPMAMPYFAARESVGERPRSEVEFYSATASNYLAAHPQNVFFGERTASWGGQERELFMGIAVPLLALIALWPPLSAARIAYALGLVIAFDVSLGFNGVTYPWLHAYVLPYRGLRVPARMAMIVGLSLSILAGYGAARISRAIRSRPISVAAFLFVATLVSLEYYSRPALDNVPAPPLPVYDILPTQTQTPVVLLELPLIQPDIALEPIYMYYSSFHWKKLVNGYSGFSPLSYGSLLEAAARLPDDDAIRELRGRQVTHVVVHGAFFPSGKYEALVSRLDGCGQFDRVASLRWYRHEVRLYRLLPSGQECSTDAHKP